MKSVKIRCFLLLFLVFLYHFLPAQNQLLGSGAEATGMGRAAVAQANCWSLFNNVAGIGGVKSLTALSTVHFGYGLAAFNTYTVGAVMPAKPVVFGVQIQHFGDKVYSEESFSIALAHKIGGAAIGFKVNLLQYRGEGMGTHMLPAYDFGVTTLLSKKVRIGAFMHNFTQKSLSSSLAEKIPSYMQLGIAYFPDPKMECLFEAEQVLGCPLLMKAGVAYAPHDCFKLRAGANFPDGGAFLGTGLKLQHFGLDYALGFQGYPGHIHQLSLHLQFPTSLKKAENAD